MIGRERFGTLAERAQAIADRLDDPVVVASIDGETRRFMPSHIDAVEPKVDQFLRMKPGEFFEIPEGRNIKDFVLGDPFYRREPRIDRWNPVSEGAVCREAWAERPFAEATPPNHYDREMSVYASWPDGHRVEIARGDCRVVGRQPAVMEALHRAHLSRAHGVQL